MKSLFFMTIFLGLTVFVMIASLGKQAYAESAQLCDDKAEKINKIKTVKKMAPIRIAPNNTSKKIINYKATEALNSTQYAEIDSSTKVREVCKKNSWSYIELTEPEWLAASHKGWVPSNALNEIKVSNGGKRIYRENEVGWNKQTKPYKKQILYAINNFLQDDCKEVLDTFSVFESSSKSTYNDPVFFISCGRTPIFRNIFFSKTEIEKKMKK